MAWVCPKAADEMHSHIAATWHSLKPSMSASYLCAVHAPEQSSWLTTLRISENPRLTAQKKYNPSQTRWAIERLKNWCVWVFIACLSWSHSEYAVSVFVPFQRGHQTKSGGLTKCHKFIKYEKRSNLLLCRLLLLLHLKHHVSW